MEEFLPTKHKSLVLIPRSEQENKKNKKGILCLPCWLVGFQTSLVLHFGLCLNSVLPAHTHQVLRSLRHSHNDFEMVFQQFQFFWVLPVFILQFRAWLYFTREHFSLCGGLCLLLLLQAGSPVEQAVSDSTALLPQSSGMLGKQGCATMRLCY